MLKWMWEALYLKSHQEDFSGSKVVSKWLAAWDDYSFKPNLREVSEHQKGVSEHQKGVCGEEKGVCEDLHP